jgi:hypothetical protein
MRIADAESPERHDGKFDAEPGQAEDIAQHGPTADRSDDKIRTTRREQRAFQPQKGGIFVTAGWAVRGRRLSHMAANGFA